MCINKLALNVEKTKYIVFANQYQYLKKEYLRIMKTASLEIPVSNTEKGRKHFAYCIYNVLSQNLKMLNLKKNLLNSILKSGSE